MKINMNRQLPEVKMANNMKMIAKALILVKYNLSQ